MKWDDYKSNLLPIAELVALGAEAVWFAASLTPWLNRLPFSPWWLVALAVGWGVAMLISLLLLRRRWDRPTFLETAVPAILLVALAAVNVGFALWLRPWLDGLSFNRWWLALLVVPVGGATIVWVYRWTKDLGVPPEQRRVLSRWKVLGGVKLKPRDLLQVAVVVSVFFVALAFGNGALALWLHPWLLRLPFHPGWLVVLGGILTLSLALLAGWWRGFVWIVRVPAIILMSSLLTAALPAWGLAYAVYVLYRDRLEFEVPVERTADPGAETDEPIAKPDRDRFDFTGYAKVLAGRVIKAHTPLTVGVFGSWGSGKTSLMRLTDAALPGKTEGGDRLFKIWISVWQLGNQEEVWHAFLQALFGKVHGELSGWRRIDKRKLLRQLASNSYRVVIAITPMVVGLLLVAEPDTGWGDALRLLLNPIAGGGTLLTVGLGLWALVKPIVERARESWTFDLQKVLKLAPYETQITELMRLHTQFESLVKALVGEKGRLVAFIDDLDRCAPEKVPEVLEALKLFAATPRCVYVMGLDHERTREGIMAKYELREDDASAYLEKIAQIPFHLPALAEEQIADFVQDEHDDVCQMCPSAPEIFSKGLEHNPRKVKRALNIYRLLLEMAEERVNAWEMDPIEEELLAKTVVIQSRCRRLYEYLVGHQGDLQRMEEAARKGDPDGGEAGETLGWLEQVEIGAEQKLVDRVDLPALESMLRVEGPYFGDLDVDELRAYFFLTGTVEASGEQLRPGRRERDALLGEDLRAIQKMVQEVQGRGATEVYVKRLYGVLRDLDRYTPSERVSANIALDLLEGIERQDFEPETVRVLAGEFLMGSDPSVDKDARHDEQPQHTLYLPDYYLAKMPVTNAQYAAFVQAVDHRPPEHWEGGEPPSGKADHPVVNVSWHDAVAYCNWLAEVTGKPYRLPSEAEWEKAARGTDGRQFPWGNEWNQSKCNTREGGPGTTTPVGLYSPGGDSPYGAADMAGNVWEWTRSAYRDYPYDPEDGRENLEAEGGRVLRGGSWLVSRGGARCVGRGRVGPGNSYVDVGFRLVSPVLF